MSPSELIPGGGDGVTAPPANPSPPPPMPHFPDEEEDGGLNLQRLLAGLLRYKWLILLFGFLGFGAAWVVYSSVQPVYTAEGSLWLEAPPAPGAAGASPIRQAQLFERGAWIELLRSYTILDPVVVKEKLYLSHAPDDADVFRGFAVDSTGYATGSFRLTVSPDGSEIRLQTVEGIPIERVSSGDSVGRSLGFRWVPPVPAIEPEREVEFRTIPARDAARALSDDLSAQMAQVGNFIRLTLTSIYPEQAAAIINSVMERHVAVAATLKRSKVDEELTVLEDQLQQAEELLSRYELELEQFRVNTITLPSEESAPIAAGLAMTQASVLSNYFNMRSALEARRAQLERLRSALERMDTAGVRVEALEAVEIARASTELSAVLQELVSARSELRVYRDRYADEYPPIQELLGRIGTIENETVPTLVRGLIRELERDVDDLQTRVDSAATELEEIPPRAIEEAQLERRVATQGSIVSDLERRVVTARLASASSTPDVRILDRASTPVVPSDDERIRFAGLALLGFWAFGIGLALVLDRVDPRFRYPDQATDDLGLEILGSIPRIIPPGRRGAAERSILVAEAFRELRMRVSFAHGSAGPVALTITSPAQEEGKSLISTNLAVAFAEMGRRTLLIDGDVRRGDAHVFVGCERVPGLTDYLHEKTDEDIIRSTEYEHLDFIPSGSRLKHSPELLAGSRMAPFVGTLKRGYDVIIVDSPPLAAGADALMLGRWTGNLLLILRTGSTDRSLARAKMDVLSHVPVRILGAVMNDIEPKGVYRYYSNYLPEYAPVDGSVEEIDEEDAPIVMPVSD